MSIPGSTQVPACTVWEETTACGRVGQGDLVREWSEAGPALSLCSPQAREQDDMVNQECIPAVMQELHSWQAGDSQKPSTQGEFP